jgi:hypothetical protein
MRGQRVHLPRNFNQGMERQKINLRAHLKYVHDVKLALTKPGIFFYLFYFLKENLI